MQMSAKALPVCLSRRSSPGSGTNFKVIVDVIFVMPLRACARILSGSATDTRTVSSGSGTRYIQSTVYCKGFCMLLSWFAEFPVLSVNSRDSCEEFQFKMRSNTAHVMSGKLAIQAGKNLLPLFHPLAGFRMHDLLRSTPT